MTEPALIEQNRATLYNNVGIKKSTQKGVSIILLLLACCRPEAAFLVSAVAHGIGVAPFFSPDAIRAAPVQHFLLYFAVAVVTQIPAYCGLCLLFEKIYYTEKKDQPEAWKCQPKKDLTHRLASLNRSEVRLSIINLCVASAMTCAITVKQICSGGSFVYVYLAAPTDLMGWLRIPLEGAFYFIWIDAWAWFAHRLMHRPWWYQNFHKWHHAYVAPTPFTALGLHPIDLACLQGGVYSFFFICPIHVGAVLINLLYIHYFNIIDHSGIYFESSIPWQATSLFHDDHHKFFHLNYGQSMTLWDRLGGTIYNKTISYSEDKYESAQRAELAKKVSSSKTE